MGPRTSRCRELPRNLSITHMSSTSTSQSAPISIRATVDVAESIRRAQPSRCATVEIPLDQVCAAVTAAELPSLAESVSERTDGTWRLMVAGRLVGGIPTVTAAGLVEAWRAAVAADRQSKAAAAVAQTIAAAQSAAEHAASVARALAAVEADISRVEIGQYGTRVFAADLAGGGDPDSTSYYSGVTPADLPSVAAAYAVELERRAAAKEARRIATESAAAALEARIQAAITASLTATQGEMRDRGLLDLAAVRQRVLRLDGEQARDDIAALLGDGYAVSISRSPDGYCIIASELSQARYRMLRRLEVQIGHQATPLSDATGGKLRVRFARQTSLGLTVWLEVTYPADIA